MGPKAKSIDEFVEALSDPRVLEALARALAPMINKTLDEHLATRLNGLNKKVDSLEAVNNDLKKELNKQQERLDELEAFTRSDNLVIRGLVEQTAAERATGSMHSTASSHVDLSRSVEQNVIAFCNDTLNVAVSSQDISIAHRLKAGPKDTARPILVRFNSRRVRNEVYQARKLLKGASSRVYI